METFSFGSLLGGIGLFLLGMTLMTEGLKAASGPMLVRFLEKTTNTGLKGFFAGFFATTLLQSSTATTLLTIGFVNAGILSFAGSLWLIFGANVGTTMTGWLVALIGLKIKVEIFALPMIGLGVILQIATKKTWSAIGGILAGFGILFLGLGFLQTAFSNVKDIIDFSVFIGHGIWSVIAFLFVGFFLSVVTQSSTVATAIILTLANTAGLPISESAAAVIGANIGTTITAGFASIGATANAKRAAWAHILFNITAGAVALLILPVFVYSIDWLVEILRLEDTVATQLALFHTAFNILGTLLMIPLAKHIANFLSKCFTQDEIHLETPKYLDTNLLSVPSLAIESLIKELDRYRDILITSVRGFVSYMQGTSSVLPQANKLDQLGDAITQFTMHLAQSSMSDNAAEQFTECLQIRDQYSKSTAYLKKLITTFKEVKAYKDPTAKQLQDFLHEVDALLGYIDTPIGAKPKSLSNRKLEEFDASYHRIKGNLTKATVTENLSVRDMEELIELVRTLRGMVRAFAKAQKIVLPQGG